MPSLESDVYDMKKALEKALKAENMKVYMFYLLYRILYIMYIFNFLF